MQAAYITQCVNAMRKFNVKVLEVKEEPTREYNAWLDRRLENTVWAKGSSFYRLGQNRNGRIFVSAFGLVRRLMIETSDNLAISMPAPKDKLACPDCIVLVAKFVAQVARLDRCGQDCGQGEYSTQANAYRHGPRRGRDSVFLVQIRCQVVISGMSSSGYM